MPRARSVEIYLKPGIEEDDQVHEIWSALRGRARPQDVFRRAIRLGLRAMAEAGELPRAALEALNPDLLGPPAPGRALMARGVKARARPPAPAGAPAAPVAPVEPAPAPVRRPEPPRPQQPVQAPAAEPVDARVQPPEGAAPPPAPAADRKPRLGRLM